MSTIQKIRDLFFKTETLVAIDIGQNGVRLVELDLSSDKLRLMNLGYTPLGGELFTNNVISKTDKVSEAISSVMEANSVTDKRVVIGMPSPSVFTKRIKMPRMTYDELRQNVNFEASNFIPHNVDQVKLDFHIIGESGKNQLDVLVVAVKNEILDSYTESLSLAGLQPAVIDVDYFALQNMFEANYPEFVEKTVALVNIGARFSSINICKKGSSLFTGDLPIGGKALTDTIAESLGIPFDQAEALKKSKDDQNPQFASVRELIDINIEYVSSELNRQLSFFWSATGESDGLDMVVLSGGGAQLPGLVEELADKTGVECLLANPLKEIAVSDSFDKDYLSEVGPLMSMCVGLAIREAGDKIIPDFV